MGITKNFKFDYNVGLRSLTELRKELAKFVGISPRDTRVDRVLRLLLRTMPINLPEKIKLYTLTEIILKLNKIVISLNKWTSKRLERRHSEPSRKLLQDAEQLGKILDKIPSPGFSIPLIKDDYELPTIVNIEDVMSSVSNLEKYVLM